MKFFYIFLFFFAACSLNSPFIQEQDDFDKIISIMKTKSTEELFRYYGKPDEISESAINNRIQILKYKDSRINAYIEKPNNDKISHLTLFYFKDFDNYTALKKRFKDYKWVETKLQDNLKSDVLTDLYLVNIPELNMEFQFDKNAPKRKVMWIYFD